MGSNWPAVLEKRRQGLKAHHRGADETLEEFAARNTKDRKVSPAQLAALKAQVAAAEASVADDPADEPAHV